MHELSLVESIVTTLEEAARREHFKHVRTVRLEIGRLSCVEPEALHFCFEAATRGSIAEGATLEIIAIPGCGRCDRCGTTAPMTELYDVCPQCAQGPLRVEAGREMRVKDIDVE